MAGNATAFMVVGRFRLIASVLFALSGAAHAAPGPQISFAPQPAAVRLADRDGASPVIVSDDDYRVVKLAAGFFAGDVEMVTGTRPSVSESPAGPDAVIVGTLGHSAVIDRLVRDGKLKDVARIQGQWEATLSQTVENPFPGITRALVIVGSDRRGAAYGLMQLSQKIGVSPWHWWADVPAASHPALYVEATAASIDKPSVKYRGIFVNDEDWGLIPWIKKTYDPQQGNIGPKTYKKIYELLLRLRLNYLWPAMHGVSTEFGAIPENAALADEYGIVMGSSHCEPMLFNNIHWNEKVQGQWDYRINKAAIDGIWEKTARDRAGDEAVWTIGIRGIHDAGMEGPPDTPTRMATLTRVFKQQEAILAKNVTTKWGPVAQIFVPYKEVLPIYDAGLEVPGEATIVWVDDNFGYIRRLGRPEERKRPGGAGVYWHLSYYGSPHSYTWVNTTSPALMWEELRKAWDNEARTLWVINVGDIKPMEIGIDYFSKLAWAPETMGPDSSANFLKRFAAENFGEGPARKIAPFLTEYYRLGTIRKPELMTRAWALSLTPERAAQLGRDYADLLKRETALAAVISAPARDAFIETIGFPARVVGNTGLIFLADRNVQMSVDPAASTARIAALRDDLAAQVEAFNTKLAGGKWNGMMPGLVTDTQLTAWSSQVRWPWGETEKQPAPAEALIPEHGWRDAAAFSKTGSASDAGWRVVEGLGTSGRAMTLLPASLNPAWGDRTDQAPYLDYAFTGAGGQANAYVDFLPSFRIHPGMKLFVAISIDGQPPRRYEVPGSGGSEDENGTIRRDAVQTNYVRLRVPLGALAGGKHIFRIIAVDPGAVVDRIWLP